MTSFEMLEVFFSYSTVDPEYEQTFSEGLEAYLMETQKQEDFNSFWYALDPHYWGDLDRDFVTENYEQVSNSTLISSRDPALNDGGELFELLDIDGDSRISHDEACTALIGRHNCVRYEYHANMTANMTDTWMMDYNLDGLVSIEEYLRSNPSDSTSYHESFYNEFILDYATAGAEAASGVTFDAIRAAMANFIESEESWYTLLSSIG